MSSASPESKGKTRHRVRKATDGFLFAERWVAPGASLKVELPVARLPTGSWVSLPVIVIHGHAPGPVVWLSAAIHGDELNGVVIVDDLARRLQHSPLCGTVLAVPVVNAFGLIHGSRYLPDHRDLNRLFPGSKRGSLGSRLAHLLTRFVLERADLGIDFHTGSGGRTNLPQIRCDLDHPENRRLAEVFSAPVTLHSTLRDGSLRAHAAKLGKPILLYEGGEAHRLEGPAISMGVQGALRVLNAVGVLRDKPEGTVSKTRFLRNSTWLRAHRSGFCRLRVELGDSVEVGDSLGTLIDAAMGTLTQIKSKARGVVIGKATQGLVTAGDAVVHLATDAVAEG